MTPTQAVVNLRTLVSTMESMLTEKEIIRRFIPRMEKIELGVLQAKIFIQASVILVVPKRLNQSVIAPEA